MIDQEQKDIVKAAIKEWMNDRYAEIGRYTVKVLLTASISVLLWKYIELRGFKIP